MSNPSRRFRSSPRSAASEILRYRWVANPAEREALRSYVDRAKAYRNECGCAMGGTFVAATLVTLILYGFLFRQFTIEHWFLDAVVSAACLFGAAFLGKTTGIGLARFRLMLLGRELRLRYSVQGSTRNYQLVQ
jgi:hypothetical protein